VTLRKRWRFAPFFSQAFRPGLNCAAPPALSEGNFKLKISYEGKAENFSRFEMDEGEVRRDTPAGSRRYCRSSMG
jgi:hypothetical protein